jgi:hypothetical protein
MPEVKKTFSNCLTFKGGRSMDIQEALSKRKENEAKIIAKTLEDNEFRKEFIDDPKAALEKATGQPLPPGVNIKVIEEEPNTVTIALPKVPENGELTDEDLENIAGGIEINIHISVG